MQLKVWKEYSGNRCAGVIPIGVYHARDGRLHGLAQFLVDNGNAVWLPDERLSKVEIAPEVEMPEELTPQPKRGRAKKEGK